MSYDYYLKYIYISLYIRDNRNLIFNINKYTRLLLYLSNLINSTISILERKIYTIINLTIKTLYSINIIKSKNITTNPDNNT